MTTAMKVEEQLRSAWAEEKERISALASKLTDRRLTTRGRDRMLDAFMARLTDGQVRRHLRQALELLVAVRRWI